jgi:hypothetical protein
MNPRRPVLKAHSKQLSERDRQTASAALDLAQNGVKVMLSDPLRDASELAVSVQFVANQRGLNATVSVDREWVTVEVAPE